MYGGASELTPAPIISSAAAAFLVSVEAVAAIYGTISTRLKRNGCLLPAPGTRDGRTLRLTPGISSASSLFVLLCLAARLAAFRSRIAPFLEKCLIFARKCEVLPAVTTSQLQILSHKTLFVLLFHCEPSKGIPSGTMSDGSSMDVHNPKKAKSKQCAQPDSSRTKLPFLELQDADGKRADLETSSCPVDVGIRRPERFQPASLWAL